LRGYAELGYEVVRMIQTNEDIIADSEMVDHLLDVLDNLIKTQRGVIRVC